MLNVKDESGFLLWPTSCKYANGSVYPYSVASSPNAARVQTLPRRLNTLSVSHSKLVLYGRAERLTPRNGGFWPGQNGDLLERFVASNTKHGVRSGIYWGC